jgi:hypothetical protein
MTCSFAPEAGRPNILFGATGKRIYTNGSVNDFSSVERKFLSLFDMCTTDERNTV